MNDDCSTRRAFLSAIAGLSLVGSVAADSTDGDVLAGGTGIADPKRQLPPTAADLGTNFEAIERIAQSRSALLFPRDTPVKFDEPFRENARNKVRELLAYDPPAIDFAPEVVERVDAGDYWRERVLISTTPWFRIPVYVLIPKKAEKAPAPAIVDLHSHGGMFLFGKEKVIDFPKNHPAMTHYHQVNYDGRPTATALANRGYVVIVSDAFMFGERRVMLDEDAKFGWDRSKYSLEDVQYLNQKCRAKESTLAKSLVLAGATWPGVVNYDDRRLVDYLSTRPEVDSDRIGCIGISMGGYRSAYLAAMETRVRAACVVGFMSSMRPMLKAHIDTHSWIHFLPGLHAWLDFPELAAITAPRALLVQQCVQDRLFPLDGMRAATRRIAELYDSARCPERFSGRFYDEPHRWTIAMQDEAFAWLDEQLGHKP